MKKLWNILLISILTISIIALNNLKINEAKIVYELGGDYEPQSLKEGLEISSSLEKVSVIAECNYDEFTYPDTLPENPTMEEVNAYRDAKRAAGRAYHTRRNIQIASSLNLKNYESVYVCSLFPFIEYTYNKNEYAEHKEEVLAKITSHRDVSNVVIKSAIVDQQEKFQIAILEANAHDTHSSNGYTGDGVTVGVLDIGLVDVTNANMAGHSITIYDQPRFNETVTDHATICASLIGGNTGIAPDVTLLSSALKTSNLYGEVEWMINNGADIINMSFGESEPTGRYDSNSAFVDNAVKLYNVICVASVGNGGCHTGKIGNPALGYNVVGVGSSTHSKNIASYSSIVVVDGPTKPTIVAPGDNLTITNFGRENSGTSYACAFTSGMIATMLEAHPDLKTKPEMVLAMLTANAQPFEGYPRAKDNGYNDQIGAGRIDLDKTIMNYNRILSFNHSGGSDGELVYHFSAYMMIGDVLQASFAWLAKATVANHQVDFNNYEAKIVRRSDGKVCAIANSNADNIQFMRYVVDKEDFYEMRIYQKCGSISSSNADRIAFAYRYN